MRSLPRPGVRSREPWTLVAELGCAQCDAVLDNLTMDELRALIADDHVAGSSVAQWASLHPLFAV